jgi:hypothetical protein
MKQLNTTQRDALVQQSKPRPGAIWNLRSSAF